MKRKTPQVMKWTVPNPESPMLDPEFDDTDELVLYEPPVLATRRCGHSLTRLDEPSEDD